MSNTRENRHVLILNIPSLPLKQFKTDTLLPVILPFQYVKEL